MHDLFGHDGFAGPLVVVADNGDLAAHDRGPALMSR
jgi:hypothetical protein